MICSTWFNKFHFLTILASVWTFGLIWGVGPLLGWSDYVPESAGYYCSINWLDESARSYITCIFLLGFILPVSLMCLSYGGVLSKVKEVGIYLLSCVSNVEVLANTSGDCHPSLSLKDLRVLIDLGQSLLLWQPCRLYQKYLFFRHIFMPNYEHSGKYEREKDLRNQDTSVRTW